MKTVFSLTILIVLTLFLFATPVAASTCPDPREDPLGYVECVIGSYISSVLSVFDSIVGSIKFAVESLGLAVKSSIEGFFDNVTYVLDSIKSYASVFSRLCFEMWSAIAGVALRVGPLAPAVIMIAVIVIAFIVYIIIRIVGLALMG